MPTQTFFNLPEEKRQTIIKLAIAEFASHDYETASISNIVKQAKIAKGSLYQYFEDKKYLYLYLIDLANQQKIAFLQNAHPPEPQMGFFPYLRWLFSISARFDLTHPDLSQIVNRAVYGDVPFRDEVLQRTKKGSVEYIQQLVSQGIAQGDINSDIDPDLATFIILTLAEGLRNFIPEKIGIDPQQLADKVPIDLDMQAVEKIFDDLILVLEQGLGSKSSASNGKETPQVKNVVTRLTDTRK
ncbi:MULTISPECIES: TetR/AcrR family transcriptional regulator [unclassified Coleofasciculus]|uniref:TetR/AcrR family transcriptional regulator n=1 Tax=unclassified Coleofasciculus TaxID=2692782 RepID=UPI00187E39DD|nr:MULTISPECIES: TetR/AcrR family transcriptional regulator [unclassified Coleofasciculus]MBE9126633.1 TetR/AcrR family transcriptional regulator [Coleofasciculus sp. LEGE 07081]MBE9148885.1 TetR/AcrR family transcriptional regulator [Coleofasciculus sp. LEGE 07092]